MPGGPAASEPGSASPPFRVPRGRYRRHVSSLSSGRARRIVQWLPSGTASVVRLLGQIRTAGELVDLVVVGWWWLVAEVGVRTVPLTTLTPLFSLRMASGSESRDTAGGDVDPALDRPTGDLDAVERRRLALVVRIASHWPGGPGPCLRQALVTGRVLGRHRPRLLLGVLPPGPDGSQPVLAHAWVELPDGRQLGDVDGTLPFST